MSAWEATVVLILHLSLQIFLVLDKDKDGMFSKLDVKLLAEDDSVSFGDFVDPDLPPPPPLPESKSTSRILGLFVIPLLGLKFAWCCLGCFSSNFLSCCNYPVALICTF